MAASPPEVTAKRRKNDSIGGGGGWAGHADGETGKRKQVVSVLSQAALFTASRQPKPGSNWKALKKSLGTSESSSVHRRPGSSSQPSEGRGARQRSGSDQRRIVSDVGVAVTAAVRSGSDAMNSGVATTSTVSSSRKGKEKALSTAATPSNAPTRPPPPPSQTTRTALLRKAETAVLLPNGAAVSSSAGTSGPSGSRSGTGSPAPTSLPWFAEDLSPEDLELVKRMQRTAEEEQEAEEEVEGVDHQGGLGAGAKGMTTAARTGRRSAASVNAGEAYLKGLGDSDEAIALKRRVILGGLDENAPPEKKEIGQYLAIDCEMVGVGVNGSESVLARVSIVNFHGHTILDRFVRPKERVTDYRTWVSGVRPIDLRDAPSFEAVQREVAAIVKGRVLVGHAIHNDLRALLLSHPRPLIRDTATFQPLRTIAKTKFPALRTLVKLVLGFEIQKSGEAHSSVEDARATMAVFRTQKAAWDKVIRGMNRASEGRWTDSEAEDADRTDTHELADQSSLADDSVHSVSLGSWPASRAEARRASASSPSLKRKAAGAKIMMPPHRRPARSQPEWWK